MALKDNKGNLPEDKVRSQMKYNEEGSFSQRTEQRLLHGLTKNLTLLPSLSSQPLPTKILLLLRNSNSSFFFLSFLNGNLYCGYPTPMLAIYNDICMETGVGNTAELAFQFFFQVTDHKPHGQRHIQTLWTELHITHPDILDSELDTVTKCMGRMMNIYISMARGVNYSRLLVVPK